MKSLSKKSATKWLLSSAIASTLIFTLAGCSNTEEENPKLEKTSDASVTEPTDYVPASADGPAQNVPEPRLPAVATENTEEGAQAALEYFWEAIDYGRLTGNTSNAELVSSPDCELCSDLISGWRDVYADDAWAALHGTMDLEIQSVDLEFGNDSDQSVAEISFTMTEPAVDFYQSGEYLEAESFDTKSTAHWWTQLVYDSTAQRWKIDWIGVEEHLVEDRP